MAEEAVVMEAVRAVESAAGKSGTEGWSAGETRTTTEMPAIANRGKRHPPTTHSAAKASGMHAAAEAATVHAAAKAAAMSTTTAAAMTAAATALRRGPTHPHE